MKDKFEQALEGIEKSMEQARLECPKCKSEDIFYHMQTLAVKDGYHIDIYDYSCRGCGNRFLIESAPLKHFPRVASI